MTRWQRLNPRLHLAAAIGWAVFAVVTLAALLSASLAAAQAEQRARADAEGLLAEYATQVRDALSMNLEVRRSLLQATAAQISATTDRSPEAVQRILQAVLGQYPEFTRLSVSDGAGQVRASLPGARATSAQAAAGAASALRVGLADQPWFQDARERPVVSDLKALPGSAGGAGTAGAAGSVRGALIAPGPRVIDIAVPLRLADQDEAGVLAAELDWAWVERLLGRMQDALNEHRPLELMLAARDGTVLAGPPLWRGRRLDPKDDVSEGGSQVVGRRTQLRLADSLGFGWTAFVRQRTDVALVAVRTTRHTVFLIVFLAGLLSAAGAMAVTRLLTRRLTWLAADAEAVRRGERRSLAAPPGADEVSRIGATLAVVVDHLQTEKQALQALNAELDWRVAERTARIEGMADEARHAAVTRERLRLARDLHDTLAHSLMALLTQIRLVRKLHRRMHAAELEDELGRAEGVAATGLAEARAAIGQMRDNGVRDTGLGPALHDLARRFRQRTGTEVTLLIDPQAPDRADQRAETMFRIVEEALRNVERHAQAAGVQISLARSPGVSGLQAGEATEVGGVAVVDAGAATRAATQVRIEVVDDGVGFDPDDPYPGHFGLRGMQEQAALIAAQLRIVSRPGQGTRVQLDFVA
jgi:signal transduction histidine kinase